MTRMTFRKKCKVYVLLIIIIILLCIPLFHFALPITSYTFGHTFYALRSCVRLRLSSRNRAGLTIPVIHWSKLPERAGADPTCSSQGVLRFDLRNETCVTGLRFVLKFNEANVGNFSFHIGDSVMDDGWGRNAFFTRIGTFPICSPCDANDI